MKIQIVSDIHLEFGITDIENNSGADVLVLSGDITTTNTLTEFEEFISKLEQQYEYIIHIQGNHEPWHSSIETMDEVLTDIAHGSKTYYYLNNNYVIVGNYIIIGCTLWTDYNRGDYYDMKLIRNSMRDYGNIKNFRPVRGHTLHKESVRYIEEVAKDNPDNTIIVVTHHAPSMLSVHPKYGNSSLNYAYATDLSKLILDNPNIKLWAHGHTHDSFDYNIGDCRVICNPFGYKHYEENPNFDPNLVVEL